MEFDLSDEQRLLQETVAQFIDNECPPARLRELYDDEVGYDSVLWKGLAELGLAGIHLPGEFGGTPASFPVPATSTATAWPI